jgi:transcriptional regulator with XRE-family HTH domain
MGYLGGVNEVRRLRNVAGVTQAALAEAAGTSQPAIAAYEAGRKSPTLATLRRLARSVGLEVTVEFVPPLTREERRSLFLHRAIVRTLAEDPDFAGILTARERAAIYRAFSESEEAA